MARQPKVAGQPCETCNEPMIQGKNGEGYCKPCYIKWKNEEKQTVNLKEPVRDVDWDKIARGKVRHAFAVEAFKMKMSLDEETKKRINNWTDFVMGEQSQEKTIQVEPPDPESQTEISVDKIPF